MPLLYTCDTQLAIMADRAPSCVAVMTYRPLLMQARAIYRVIYIPPAYLRHPAGNHGRPRAIVCCRDDVQAAADAGHGFGHVRGHGLLLTADGLLGRQGLGKVSACS